MSLRVRRGGYVRAVAGNAAQVRSRQSTLGAEFGRPRRRRVRDTVVHNVINYLVWSTYLGAGVVVAASNRYLDLDHVSAVTPVISASLAVLFWPIVFLGPNLRL